MTAPSPQAFRRKTPSAASLRVPFRTRFLGVVAVLVLALLGGVFTPTAATAAPSNGISVVDDKTEPIYDYEDAVRERIFIPVVGLDQDLDEVTDVTAIDIIRPRTADPELRFAAIIDPSPYFTTLGRGNEGALIRDIDGDGLNDVWPLFYDNYFVPRGYAVILAHMNGTGFSTGCPMHGGPGDIASMKAVIDWLNGRIPGYDADDNPVLAAWHNGHAAMIGKSYDGTLANGVAATGVGGLTTIVPIDAISDWYKYSRTGGIRHNTNYPSGLASTVTNPDRRSLCAPTRATLNDIDGDENGDVNTFWAERNYLSGIANVTASVFAVQGLNDDNVRMDHFGVYWDLLTEHEVPRKVWLAKVGHIDPFDFRRAEWVDTLHRWFDYWLYGVDNDIMEDPMATVETDPGVFVDYADWPVPGTQNVEVYLAGNEDLPAGALLLQSSDAVEEAVFTGSASTQSDSTLMQNPDSAQNGRLVFLSQPLTAPLRISGTARVELTAALDKAQSNLAAILVDYGPATRTPRSPGDGVQNTAVRTCWGEASDDDDACYLEVALRSASVNLWRVAQGILDSSNRNSLINGQAETVTPGESYEFSWPLQPYDQTFPVGHRIGVVVAANLNIGVIGTPSTQITVDTTVSKIILPLVGGLDAAAASGAFGLAAPVTLSFDLGGHGTAIADQTVPYGEAPAEPDEPGAAGWVFEGWFSDPGLSTPFDFDAELRADAVAYAGWSELVDVVTTLDLQPSALSVNQGGKITITVEGFDAGGNSLGDVTPFVHLESDVDTDEIVGNEITFLHASPHLITATLGAASASVSIWVEPAAIPADTGDLAITGGGLDLSPLLLAFLLAAAGGVFVFVRGVRHSRTVASVGSSSGE